MAVDIKQLYMCVHMYTCKLHCNTGSTNGLGETQTVLLVQVGEFPLWYYAIIFFVQVIQF